MAQLIIHQQRRKIKCFRENLNGIVLEMAQIPSGTFKMGTPEEEIERLCKEYEVESFKAESPQHEVSILSFFMGRYPITQEQWSAIASLEPVAQQLEEDPSTFKGNKRPVELVSWRDAIEFCARLSRETGKKYRLPSEAEWEYACRAGTQTPFHFGKTISTKVANYNGNYVYERGEKGEFRKETTEVDWSGVANNFGLSEMHGNVWEWCLDPWHENYINAPNDGSVWDEKNKNDNRCQDILSNISVLLKDER